MTPYEEGKAAKANRRSAWDNPYPTGSDAARDNPYPTGSDAARDWARGHSGKLPL